MGQTAEDIRDNIVKIADENGNCVGTGFFIHKEYCVTCHHNICKLDKIYIEREEENIEGQHRIRRHHAKWVEEFSDMQKDVAFLKVKNADFKPLEYRKETYGTIPVVVWGFPFQDLYNFPLGRDESGTLTDILKPFRWKEEEIVVESEDKKKKWNTKPEVNISVYAFNGKFYEGFSGAPVCYQHDRKIVGMFEAKDDNQGFIIPMHLVIEKFDLEKKRRSNVSAPSPTLDTGKIIHRGNEYLVKHEYLKAIEQYENILNDSNYATALYNKGLALSYLEKHEEAIECFDKSLQLNPKELKPWFSKGVSLGVLGKNDEAITYFDKALEINPNYALAWSEKGLSLGVLGKNDEAISCYDKALKINPNYAKVWNDKGAILSDLGKHEEAIECYNKSLEINPNEAMPWRNKAISLNILGKHEEAIECCNRALEINPHDAITLYNKGYALEDMGKHEEAIECYNKSLEINPDDATTWSEKGLSLHKLGKHEEAIECYNRALEINPNYAMAWSEKGICLGYLARHEEAIECFDKSLQLNPNEAMPWRNKAQTLDRLGRYQEAIKSYEKALEINPNDVNGWNGKGTAFGKLGRYEEAISCYDRALDIYPNYAPALYNRARSKVKKGDIKNGLADLRKAIEINRFWTELARQDKDFDSIRNDERFKAVIRNEKI
jgi:tetratricopeptide (TPR) repeat protein